jgi:hypothetical protein
MLDNAKLFGLIVALIAFVAVIEWFIAKDGGHRNL